MSDTQTRRFFFFPHGLEKSPDEAPKAFRAGHVPWRVQLAVHGDRVSKDGSGPSDGIVMGDGFFLKGGSVVAGGNQDPCLFSTPFHGMHVYCRSVHRQGTDNDVALLGGVKSGELLPNVAKPGDVVIYGKPDFDKGAVGIDTVLVVGESIEFQEALRRAGPGTDAFDFTLSDAQQLGSHPEEDKQRILVGAAAITWQAVDDLKASFAPLAGKSMDGRWSVLRVKVSDEAAHRVLFDLFKDVMFAGKGAIANKGRICELPPKEAEVLVRATIETSGSGSGVPGTVFTLPLKPRGRFDRLGNDGMVRTHADHMERLGG